MPLVTPLLLLMNERVAALESVSYRFSPTELNLPCLVRGAVVKDAIDEASLWKAFLLTFSDSSSTASEAETRECLQSFFNERCRERAQFAHTVLSGFARTPFGEGRALAPVIEFYWDVALDLFQPKLLAEMVSRLFPGIQRSVGIDGVVAAGELPISENFTLTMQVSDGVQLIDNDESATDVDQLLNLIVDGDVLLDLRHVQRLPLRQLTQFVELLEKSHPALVALLPHRTSDLDQMLSHVGVMREKGTTLRAVLQNLITALQMGGVELTGKEAEATAGADSAVRYFCYQFLPVLPRELSNQFLALNAPHARKVIIQGVEHVPSIGLFVQIWTSGEQYCVSEAAKSLTSIARYNPNQATLDQQAPRLTLQQRQQLEARYGQQELAVCAAEPTQVIPEQFAKQLFGLIEVSSPTGLINWINRLPPSHFLQLLRYARFVQSLNIVTLLYGGIMVNQDPLLSLMDSTFRALLHNEGVTPTGIRLPFLRALLQLGKPLHYGVMRKVMALTPTDTEVLALTDEFPSLQESMLDWATSSSDPMPINVTADVLRFFPQELRDNLVNAEVVTQFFAQTEIVETIAKVFMMFSASARQQLTLPNWSIATVLKFTPLIPLDDLKRLINRAVATHTLGFDEYNDILKATHSDETSEYAGELRGKIVFKSEEEAFMAISSWRDHLDQQLLATHFKKFTENDWDSFGNNPLRRILSLEALAALIRCLEKWQDVGPNTIQTVAGYPLQSPSYGMFMFAAKILWGRDPKEVQKLLPEYAAAFTHTDIKQNKIALPITVWQTVLFYAGLEEFRKPLLALSNQLIPQGRPTEVLANVLCDALSVVPSDARLALVRNVRMVEWVALLPMDSLKKVFAQLAPDESVELLRVEWCAGLDTLEDMVVNKGLACWLRLRSALPPATIELLNQQHVPLPAFKKVEDLSYVLKLTQIFEKIFEDHLPATIAANGKKDIKKSVLWEVIDTENALTAINATRYATVLAKYASKTPDFKPSAEKLLQHLAKKFPDVAIAQVSKANGVELPSTIEQSSATNSVQHVQSGFLVFKK